jgi:hypothetical protein
VGGKVAEVKRSAVGVASFDDEKSADETISVFRYLTSIPVTIVEYQK